MKALSEKGVQCFASFSLPLFFLISQFRMKIAAADHFNFFSDPCYIGLTARMKNIPGEHPFLYMYAPVEHLLMCAYQGAKGKCTVFSHLQTS